MQNRLNIISNHLSNKSEPKGIDDIWSYFNWSSILTESEEKIRLELREMLEKDIEPHLIPYIAKNEFPEFVISKLLDFGIGEFLVERPYGNFTSVFLQAAIISELGRIDASLATFVMVQFCLCADTILKKGSEAQKDKYIPKLKNLQYIGGWALTEPDFGSDASSIQTSVTPTEGGYILNGEKRWPGNANRDIMVVFAKNSQSKTIEGFIIENSMKGVSTKKIENKVSLRMVQNSHIYFENVFIPSENKLPGIKGFESTASMLTHTRSIIPWLSAGIAMGVYEKTVKFARTRKQFGSPIAKFQLMQDKISRIAALTNALISTAHKLTSLVKEGKATIGMAALTKSYASKTLREVVQLGREAFGGNGILLDNYVMKAFIDAESLYTYEGTYDINILIAGRELTGYSAFKAGK